MKTLRDTAVLAGRVLREIRRQPALEAGNVFIPIFFFFVTVGSIESIASSAFGVDDFVAFQVPVAVLQGVANTTAGFGLVLDMERGYFDKLLVTPASRLSIVLARMVVDAIRGVVLGAVILGVGFIAGAGMETGVLGALVIIGIGGVFSLAYSGLSVALALKTGSNQAVQLSFLLFFPLVFLSTAFAPKDVFAGWLEFLATWNPITYMLEAMRSLMIEGWDAAELGKGFAAIGGLAVVTTTLVALAYRYRKV
jgi:ABC-2 type transport system permease protein